MPNFIVRVQFRTESQGKYTILRDNLINIGFTKRVKSEQGIEYRLPNGNYRINTQSTCKQVLTAVQNIALKIETNPMIFVCEVKEKGMAWAGLDKC